MQVRKLPVAQGLAWFRAAVDLGGRNPKAVFGAALLFMATIWVVFFLIVASTKLLQGAGAIAVILGQLCLLGMMILTPMLIGGLMHVIREAESERPVRASDLFAPFHTPRGRSLALLGVLQIVVGILGGALFIALVGPTFAEELAAAMKLASEGGPFAMPELRHPWLVLFVYLAFNYFTYAIMLFAVPLILFSGLGIVEALRGAVTASVRNLGANLVAAALFALGVLVALLVVLLLSVLLAWVGSFVHPVVGEVLATLPGLVYVAALLVVVAGGAFLAWRDTFDAPGTLPPPSFGGIEA